MLLLSLFSSLFPFHDFLLHPLHCHHQHPSLYWLLFLTIFSLCTCHRNTPTWVGTHTLPVLYLRMSTNGCPNYDTFLKYACFGHTQKENSHFVSVQRSCCALLQPRNHPINNRISLRVPGLYTLPDFNSRNSFWCKEMDFLFTILFCCFFFIIWRFVYCFRSAPMTFTSKALLFCCSSNVLVSSEMVFSCSATFLRRRNSFECCMCFAGTVAIKCGSRCTSTSLVLLSRSFLVML